MQTHEYTLLGGVNRSTIGRYLGTVAATISGAIVFILLSAVNLAKELGLSTELTPTVLSLVGAGTVFAALYSFFDRYAWRWPFLNKWLKVPNLAGVWRCEGQTLNSNGSQSYAWQGTITIIQSWDKIRVRLKTSQSGSNSITAALIYDEADGYRLLYNYKNDPKIGETELKSHLGFAELIFLADRQSAEGEYFNGHGRFTFGTMHLRRD